MATATITKTAPKQRHAAPITSYRADSSDVKSILFYVHDDDRLAHRLEAALSMARSCSAHLQLLNVVPIEAYTVTDSFGGTFISAEIGEALEKLAGETRAKLEEKLSKEDVSWDYVSCTSVSVAELVAHAALADVVIMGREPRVRDFGRMGMGLAGQFLHQSRTPLFIPGSGKLPDLTGPALIAWNGSFEAANAVRSTIGLLKLASDVRVIRYAEANERVFPNLRLLEYLSRHGIHVEMEERKPHGEIASNLVTNAVTSGAGYMLMGAYSHSRAGESLFGGVTRDLLSECPVSLLMAH